MSNLLKSKFLIGVMTVAIMFVGAVALNATTASADCTVVPTLRSGSTGTSVACVQTIVGATADGKFGPLTKAAVMAWQSGHDLTADGVVGPLTAAKMNTGGAILSNYPAGCVIDRSTGLMGAYSISIANTPCVPIIIVTGGSGSVPLCPNSMTLASNCTLAPNAQSVPLCPNGATVASNCATAPGGVSTPSGTNGYLTDVALDSTNRVSTVYESEQDKIVAGFRATARLADQTVDRVRYTFTNTNSSASSANLSKYISSASLWNGSTKLATIPVASADRNTSTDVYTFNFTGLNSKVLKDQIGHFYVSVSANGSVDSADTDAVWSVVLLGGGTSASSPDGSYDTYPSSSLSAQTFAVNKFSANGVKATVGLSSSSPTAGVVTVQNTSATSGVTLLKFTVKATNSDLTLRKVPITVVAVGNDVSAIVNTFKLYQGTNLVDSVDSSNGFTVGAGITAVAEPSATTTGYIFSNLSDPYNKITAGSTVEYTVVADLKQVTGNYAAGNSLTASLANVDVVSATYLDFSVNDVNGDQLTASSTYRTGSAVGQTQTLLVNGVNVVMGTPSYTTVTDSGNVTQVTYTIPMTATAIGDTLYIGQAVGLGDAAINDTTTAQAFSLSFEDSTAPAVHINSCGAGCVETFASSDATIESNGFRLDSGTAKHFTITVTEITPTTAARSYRLVVNDIRAFTTALLTNGTSTNQSLVPVQNFQTSYQYITS